MVTVSGEETSFFKIHAPSHHSVFIFESDAVKVKNVSDLLNGYPKNTIKKVIVLPKGMESPTAIGGADLTVVDRDGHAHTFYPPVMKGFPVIVIRPDGVVGAVVKGVEGVQRYFKGIFGY